MLVKVLGVVESGGRARGRRSCEKFRTTVVRSYPGSRAAEKKAKNSFVSQVSLIKRWWWWWYVHRSRSACPAPLSYVISSSSEQTHVPFPRQPEHRLETFRSRFSQPSSGKEKVLRAAASSLVSERHFFSRCFRGWVTFLGSCTRGRSPPADVHVVSETKHEIRGRVEGLPSALLAQHNNVD